MFEIPDSDFALIARAMLAKLRADAQRGDRSLGRPVALFLPH